MEQATAVHALLIPLLLLLFAAGCSPPPASPPDHPAGASAGDVNPTADGIGVGKTSRAPLRVGFDVDDTLLFSSPNFETAKAADGVEPYSPEFWALVNRSDEAFSKVKVGTREILEGHRAAGDELYAITGRDPDGGEALQRFIETTFGIPAGNVYLEPEDKAARIRALGLDIFYGDSDGDMAAAIEAGAAPVRILRSPESTYTRHYHPGTFGEEIVEGSER